MKFVINHKEKGKYISGGLRYNLHQSMKIGWYESPCPANEYHYFKEALFVTAKGNFFLVGEGNALSRYRERCEDLWGGVPALEPISKRQAFQWAERFLTVKNVEKYFGDMIEEA